MNRVRTFYGESSSADLIRQACNKIRQLQGRFKKTSLVLDMSQKNSS